MYNWSVSHKYLATGAGRAVEEFVVIKRTAQFLVETNVTVLRHIQCLIATGTVQSDRLGHDQLQIAATLTTPAQQQTPDNEHNSTM